MGRGQGTVEYLVIIAVVVVLGLAVTVTLSTFMGNAGEVSESASNLYWRAASPFAITEAGYNSTTHMLYLTFSGKEKLNYFNIGLDQNANADSSYAYRTINRQLTLSNSLSSVQTTDDFVIIPSEIIYINYDTMYIASQGQYPEHDLVVRKIA